MASLKKKDLCLDINPNTNISLEWELLVFYFSIAAVNDDLHVMVENIRRR